MYLVKCSKTFVQRDSIITPKAKAIKSLFHRRTIIVGALKMEISLKTNIFKWKKKISIDTKKKSFEEKATWYDGGTFVQFQLEDILTTKCGILHRSSNKFKQRG